VKTEEALGSYLTELEIIEQGSDPADWYNGGWFYFKVRGRQIPFFPVSGFKKGLIQHDLHHLVCGFGTGWKGECEVAVWEIASGGCGPNLIYWMDRLTFFPIAFLCAPLRCSRALLRGLKNRNLYKLDTGRLLAMEFEEVVRLIEAPQMRVEA
jgi:hypothetical protein